MSFRFLGFRVRGFRFRYDLGVRLCRSFLRGFSGSELRGDVVPTIGDPQTRGWLFNPLKTIGALGASCKGLALREPQDDFTVVPHY